MMYNELVKYKEHLETMYTYETSRTYSIRLNCLLKNQISARSVRELDISEVISELAKIKYKNHFSQSKNAFYRFCEYYKIVLTVDELKQIDQLQKNTKKKYRKLPPRDFKEIDKRIKHMRNKKLKISYQVMVVTGLRVFELAQLTPTHCLINDDEVCFYFIGKGGKEEKASINKIQYPKLYTDLLKMINDTAPTKKLFYSVGYLQKKAKEYNFHCLDLRRAYAKLEYKKHKSKRIVMKNLRHSSIRTTNIYLRSKVKI